MQLPLLQVLSTERRVYRALGYNDTSIHLDISREQVDGHFSSLSRIEC
jgi:hypothetical protein